MHTYKCLCMYVCTYVCTYANFSNDNYNNKILSCPRSLHEDTLILRDSPCAYLVRYMYYALVCMNICASPYMLLMTSLTLCICDVCLCVYKCVHSSHDLTRCIHVRTCVHEYMWIFVPAYTFLPALCGVPAFVSWSHSPDTYVSLYVYVCMCVCIYENVHSFHDLTHLIHMCTCMHEYMCVYECPHSFHDVTDWALLVALTRLYVQNQQFLRVFPFLFRVSCAEIRQWMQYAHTPVSSEERQRNIFHTKYVFLKKKRFSITQRWFLFFGLCINGRFDQIIYKFDCI
jgi:hypothetical protein